MFDEQYNLVELANRPTQILLMRIPYVLNKGDMIRKVSGL